MMSHLSLAYKPNVDPKWLCGIPVRAKMGSALGVRRGKYNRASREPKQAPGDTKKAL
jgi:hypothetical protein